jgi:hypothetical protein
MKASRLLGLLFVLLFCSTFALAGPPIAISDPGCPDGGIALDASGAASFTVGIGTPSVTICNTTSGEGAVDYRSLNFTINFASSVFLDGIYCGAPDTGPAAFDYCNVLDPSNGDALVNHFVAGVDTPSSFYADGGPSEELSGTLAHLSFNLFDPILSFATFESEFDPRGLQAGDSVTIFFTCTDTESRNGCEPIQAGSGVSLLASTSTNTGIFPVPEPATILLIAGAGLPMAFRRFRKS